MSFGEVIGGQDRHNPFQRQRVAGVDLAHLRMGHGTSQQLDEEHSRGAKVLGKLGFARNLAHEVGRGEIFPNEFIASHISSPPLRA